MLSYSSTAFKTFIQLFGWKLRNNYDPIYGKTYVDVAKCQTWLSNWTWYADVYIYVSTMTTTCKNTHQLIEGDLCDHTMHIARPLTFSQSKTSEKSFCAAHIDYFILFNGWRYSFLWIFQNSSHHFPIWMNI